MRGGLSVTEFLPHNSAINSRFQSEFWPIFENHAIKFPAHLGILRVRGGSSHPRTHHQTPLRILRARGGKSYPSLLTSYKKLFTRARNSSANP